MICGISGFIFAYLLTSILRHKGWSRFIWHLPVFFLALWAIFTFLLELLLMSA